MEGLEVCEVKATPSENEVVVRRVNQTTAPIKWLLTAVEILVEVGMIQNDWSVREVLRRVRNLRKEMITMVRKSWD